MQKNSYIDQKSIEVARERMSQRDLLLDGDSPLRVELQLQPSVSALDRAHALHNMLSAVFSVPVALSKNLISVCVRLSLRV